MFCNVLRVRAPIRSFDKANVCVYFEMSRPKCFARKNTGERVKQIMEAPVRPEEGNTSFRPKSHLSYYLVHNPVNQNKVLSTDEVFFLVVVVFRDYHSDRFFLKTQTVQNNAV